MRYHLYKLHEEHYYYKGSIIVVALILIYIAVMIR